MENQGPKTANQLYKESGTTLSFKEWLEREKAKGTEMRNAQIEAALERLRDGLLPKDHFYDDDLERIQHRGWRKVGDDMIEDFTDLCSPLAITSLTKSEDDKGGGLLLQWIDRGGNLRDWLCLNHCLQKTLKALPPHFTTTE